MSSEGNRFFILILICFPLVSNASIIYVSDQGFTREDGASGLTEVIQFGDGEGVIYRDFRSSGAWMIDHRGMWTYEAAVSEDGGVAKNLMEDSEIGDGIDWFDLSSTRLGLSILNYREGTGEFFDAYGFLGVRFFSPENAQPFYGWMRLEHNAQAETFTVHDWAWNSEPGVPIAAGEIPETKVYALLLAVGTLLWAMVRRRST